MIQAVKTELCQYLLIKEVWTDGTRLQKGLFFSFFDIGEIFQGFPEQLRVRTAPLPDKWNPLARFQIKCLVRSEEHTSELQSRGHLVCRLLLEKKKTVLRDLIWLHSECS